MPDNSALSFNNIKNENYQSVYVNNTTFQTTAFDFGMIFGEIIEIDGVEATATVDQKVRVVMSPLHAKIFGLILMQNVQQFEAKFGEIKLHEGAVGVRTAEGHVDIATGAPVE
jgi:hypothetical protein